MKTDRADDLPRAREFLSRAAVDLAAETPLRRLGRYSCPDLSGVALSFNPYAWNEYIAPADGVARLAFGCPSRLHDRSGEDFTRLVPLGAPGRRPETSPEEVARYSQRQVDVLNVDTGRTETLYLVDLLKDAYGIPLPLLTSEYRSEEVSFPILTFERLLSSTPFVADLRKTLQILREGFGADVEIEFAAELSPDSPARFSLLSCRTVTEAPVEAHPNREVLFEAEGAVIGPSRRASVNRAVCVRPAAYSQLAPGDRYEIARLIGRVNAASDPGRTLFLGPGRWCTSSPDLGIPADFSEISRAAAVVEIVAMREGLVPEVSRGSHLLNELVARDILYLAIFPGKPHNDLDDAIFERLSNRLAEIVPGSERWGDVLAVVDGAFEVIADVKQQRALGFAAK